MKKIIVILIVLFISACSQVSSLQPPSNIRLEGDIIRFDAVTEAKHYEIEINSYIHKIDLNEYLLENSGTFLVRVRSIDEKGNKSNFSSLYTFRYEADVVNFEPYIIDGDSREYVLGEELVINFSFMQGFYIKSITAPNNDISKNEYIIDGNKVVLKNTFLDRKFNEDRKDLILAFVISNNNDQFIVNLFIKKDN